MGSWKEFMLFVMFLEMEKLRIIEVIKMKEYVFVNSDRLKLEIVLGVFIFF